MTATGTIKRGDFGALDPVTLEVGGLSNVTTIYSGKMRVRLLSGSGVITSGEQTIDTRTTQITIPIDAVPVPRRDDLVTVTDYSSSDLDVNARVFRVMEVEGGGLFGYGHVMTCVSWYESRYWGE
jgi:hypothetical protein